MSKVNNLCPMERLIHQAFHDLAGKYEIDVDTVAEIIEEFNDIMSKYLERRIIVHAN